MTNSQVAYSLNLLAKLIELTGGNDFKAKAYAAGAFKISKARVDIAAAAAEDIEKIEGIGTGIIAKIKELKQTGTIAELDTLIQQVPAGVIEMLGIKGLGAKKVRTIWQELGIESVGELLYACNENRLAKLKGFGEKTQQEVVKAIEFRESAQGKMLYYIAEEIANTLIKHLQDALPACIIAHTGELRRKLEVLEEIELLIDSTDTAAIINVLEGFEAIADIALNDNHISFKLNRYRVVLYYTTVEGFAYTLWQTTGSPLHIQQVNYTGPQTVTEEELYQSKGLHYIVPELREGLGEVELATQQPVSEGLVTVHDIKGSLHNHSTYSDGMNTLREMALFCKEQGWEYFGICDHSQSAAYAGGLKPDKVLAQHAEIDALNRELAPFKILKGIESDILTDGSLDYTDDILERFDFVVASIHQGFKMTEEQATARIIKAIENPYTTILGHMTGRLLLARAGYPVNHAQIIDACAKHSVVIELNANPNRLDIDWRWIKYATAKGVMISINPDAHSIRGLLDTYYGVQVARKGYLNRNQTFNCFSLAEIENWMVKRKSTQIVNS